MHHSIDYSRRSGADKQLAALADANAWLSDSAPKVASFIQSEATSSINQMARSLAFAGIQGYPAWVFVLWSLRSVRGIQLGD